MTTPVFTTLADEEYDDRLERFRESYELRDSEFVVVYGNEYVPGDVQYLTGYDPQIEAAAAIVGKDVLLVLGGPEGEEMFADQGAHGTWYNLDTFEIPFQVYGPKVRFRSLAEVLSTHRLGDSGRAVSATRPIYLPVGVAKEFSDLGLPLGFEPEPLATLRYLKSTRELELFRRSSEIASKAFEAMHAALEPGITELEIAGIGDATMKSLGAYTYGWDSMVLSGPRINSIIGRASSRVIDDGDLVLLGACPRYGGYASTVGRTVVAGEASSEQLHFLATGAHALKRAANELRADGDAARVDLAARSFLTEEGLGDYHAYGVGHGIGFSECLEDRTATQLSDYRFPRGISISIDVGIFRNPSGLNGRFEDPYVIDHDGNTHRLTGIPELLDR